jgi:hypothetical protein
MTQLHGRDEFEHLIRCNRAHQAETQRRLLQANEILRVPLGLVGLAVDLLQIRLDGAAELREMRVGTLAVEQGPAELRFQHPDGARERWLADIAAESRTGEIQFVAKRQKITDLMHFHRGYPGDNADFARVGKKVTRSCAAHRHDASCTAAQAAICRHDSRRKSIAQMYVLDRRFRLTRS